MPDRNADARPPKSCREQRAMFSESHSASGSALLPTNNVQKCLDSGNMIKRARWIVLGAHACLRSGSEDAPDDALLTFSALFYKSAPCTEVSCPFKQAACMWLSRAPLIQCARLLALDSNRGSSCTMFCQAHELV
eukprot:4080773-Pleurochrysis_carterae.AAC.1